MFEARIIAPWSAVSEQRQAGGDNGVELKMRRRMETMPVVILRGRNSDGGGRGGKDGGGPLVKPICTSDALSIPRTADNFTGLYLRWLPPRRNRGRRSAYPNSFTYFPLSRKYVSRFISFFSTASFLAFPFFSLFLSLFSSTTLLFSRFFEKSGA